MAPENEREGEGTKFLIDRKIFTSDIWFASPWKFKIFFYLIGNANHKPKKFKGIPIERGQLIRSYRRIQKDCGYMVGYRLKKPSLDTVRRICEELTKESRIVQRTVHCGTLFTVCNYNALQAFPKPRTVRRTRQRPNGDRTQTEQNKNEKRMSEENTYTADFLKLWDSYPRKVGKAKAFQAWQKANAKPDLETLISILGRHKMTEQWQKENGRYIPHPASWINGRRWEDEISCQYPSSGFKTTEQEAEERWMKTRGKK